MVASRLPAVARLPGCPCSAQVATMPAGCQLVASGCQLVASGSGCQVASQGSAQGLTHGTIVCIRCTANAHDEA
eukprot:5277429-Prymnesium_polylepis.1